MDSPAPPRLVALACLALSMALVGSYVALSKPLVAVFPVFLLAWLRFGIGGLAMLSWLRKPASEAPMSRRTRLLVFLESLLGNFMFSIFMLFGVSMTSAVSAGVIMASIPAVVALLSWAFLRERIAPRVWIAVACAAAGIALLALGKPAAEDASVAHGSWQGNLLVFGAVVCEAAYAVIGKKLTGVLGPRRISALINLWGFVLVTPMGAWAAWHFDFSAPHIGIWWLLVFYALAASIWTVWLWMAGLRTVSASQAGVFTVMLPVSAAAVGVLLLDERLVGLQWLAFALALAGVLLATLPAHRPQYCPWSLTLGRVPWRSSEPLFIGEKPSPDGSHGASGRASTKGSPGPQRSRRVLPPAFSEGKAAVARMKKTTRTSEKARLPLGNAFFLL